MCVSHFCHHSENSNPIIYFFTSAIVPNFKPVVLPYLPPVENSIVRKMGAVFAKDELSDFQKNKLLHEFHTFFGELVDTGLSLELGNGLALG